MRNRERAGAYRSAIEWHQRPWLTCASARCESATRIILSAKTGGRAATLAACNSASNLARYGYFCAGPTVSATYAPRVPIDFGGPVVVSRTV
jgi:hypothetical protein